MCPSNPHQKSLLSRRSSFATTHWSVVVAAAGRPDSHSQEALATLCSIYWYPLYAYVRRQGYSAEEGQDLTQGFFARLLEKNYLQDVKRERGKFRSFLLASLKHFLANERDRVRAQKRGGGSSLIPLDITTAEGRYSLEPSHEMTPEKIFDRRWALTLLDQVLARLREEFASAGKTDHFDRLKIFLTGEAGIHYRQIAAEMKMKEGAFKVAIHRLRRRYRDLLREEIAQTVADPDDIEAEIRHLFAAISS